MMLHLLRSLAYVKTFFKHISHYELLSEVTLSGLNTALVSSYLKHKGKVRKLAWLSSGENTNYILKNVSAVYVHTTKVNLNKVTI